MADGTLSGEEFGRNILEFMQVSDSLKDGWELQHVESCTQQLFPFLVKRNVLRALDIVGAASTGYLTENEHLRTEGASVKGKNMEMMEEEGGSDIEDVDLSLPDGQAAGVVCRFDYHIVYSPSYGVPALYFSACHGDGKLLSLNEVWHSVPCHYQKRLENERWTFITQQEHPILGRPFFFLHPCHTADLMKAVSKSNNSTPLPHRNYLVTWLSSVGPAVGLSLPLEYAELCKGM